MQFSLVKHLFLWTIYKMAMLNNQRVIVGYIRSAGMWSQNRQSHVVSLEIRGF